jgi:hypothetical protein
MRTEPHWQRDWQVLGRRLTNAPSVVAESAEFQALTAQLDQTFLAGNARAFAEAGVRVIELCEQIVTREGIAPWW